MQLKRINAKDRQAGSMKSLNPTVFSNKLFEKQTLDEEANKALKARQEIKYPNALKGYEGGGQNRYERLPEISPNRTVQGSQTQRQYRNQSETMVRSS